MHLLMHDSLQYIQLYMTLNGAALSGLARRKLARAEPCRGAFTGYRLCRRPLIRWGVSVDKGPNGGLNPFARV